MQLGDFASPCRRAGEEHTKRTPETPARLT